jgi:sulfate transport system ATP-binding protein
MNILVKNLSKTYDSHRAVQDVSFSIKEGQLIGLLGPSGGGKTSVLRMLAGLEKPTYGDIYLGDQLATHIPIQKREIGFVFQHYALFKHMTVFENVAYGLKVKKESKEKIKQKVNELLELMGLVGTQYKYPHQLSGGQRQRVAFARALAPEPKLLLLDEPFSAIDAKVRKELRSWLRKLISEVGVTSIFVTHDQDEAIEVADELLIMNGGKLEQQGSPWEVYRNPATPFVATFIGESNHLDFAIELKGYPGLKAYQEEGRWKEGIIVQCRPESIELYPNDKRYEGYGDLGVINHVHFRGDAWYLEIKFQNQILVAYQSVNEEIYNTGDEVRVVVRRLNVFSESKNLVLDYNVLESSNAFK